MTSAFRPETLVAVDAVGWALELARRRAGAEEITSKGARDVVTATDVAVEDALRDRVSRTLGFSVIGEERGGEASADGSPYWLVDPICGTRNFASGHPLYCVNLALVEGDQITLAVVGDPSTGEIHVAERGGGAWALRDGSPRRLATSDESRTIVIEVGRSTGYVASTPRDSWPTRSGRTDGTCGPSAPRCRCRMWPRAAWPRTCCSRSRRCTPERAACSSPKREASCPISTASHGRSNQTPSSRALIPASTGSCSTLPAQLWSHAVQDAIAGQSEVWRHPALAKAGSTNSALMSMSISSR